MQNQKTLAFLLTALFIALSIGIAVVLNQFNPDPLPPVHESQGHPVRFIGHGAWSGAKDVPWEEKAKPASQPIIDLLHWDNERQGWKERPRAAGPSPELRRDLKEALAGIPTQVQRAVGSKLFGIYLVEELGGSAYSNSLLGADGKPMAGFVALDIGVLNRKANEWMTWKESSPYKGDAFRLRARIENDADDTRVAALRYILLHELGHILAIGRKEVIDLDGSPGRFPNLFVFDFTGLTWLSRDKFVTRFDGPSFPARGNMPYYASPDRARSSENMLGDYEALVKTDLPSMYATIHPHDDFAESFVTYVHSELLKKPWEIEINDARGPRFTLKPCWNEERCDRKRKVLESILFEGS